MFFRSIFSCLFFQFFVFFAPAQSVKLARFKVDSLVSKSILKEFYGYINLEGKVIIPPIYTTAMNFSENKAYVELWDKKKKSYSGFFIDRTGKKVLPVTSSNLYSSTIHWKNKFHKGYEFHEGYCAIMDTSKKFAFIDSIGKFITPFMYDIVDKFSEGLAYVAIRTDTMALLDRSFNIRGTVKHIGYIDSSGKFAVPLPHDYSYYDDNYSGCFYYGSEFKNGLARLEIREDWGDCNEHHGIKIDKQGHVFPDSTHWTLSINQNHIDAGEGFMYKVIHGSENDYPYNNRQGYFVDKNDKLIIALSHETSSGLMHTTIPINSFEIKSYFFYEGIASIPK